MYQTLFFSLVLYLRQGTIRKDHVTIINQSVDFSPLIYPLSLSFNFCLCYVLTSDASHNLNNGAHQYLEHFACYRCRSYRTGGESPTVHILCDPQSCYVLWALQKSPHQLFTLRCKGMCPLIIINSDSIVECQSWYTLFYIKNN